MIHKYKHTSILFHIPPSAMLIKANMLTKYPDQITIKVMITDCTAFNHF